MHTYSWLPTYQPGRSTDVASVLPGPQRPIRRRFQLTIFLIPLLALAACGGNSGAGWGPGSTQGNTSTQNITSQGGLIILSTPTFQFVLPTLANAFFTSRGLHVPYAFDFSSAKQIANTANTSADADLLVADSQQIMLNSHNIGFIRSTGTLLATDYLSVVLPGANPGNIHSLQDLTTPGLRYLGISPQDALNLHIQATLESMQATPTFGSYYAARVYGNLISSYTDGLLAAQTLVASPPGGDFAIVYHTNYLTIQKQHGVGALTELSIPSQFNPPLPMLASVTDQATNPGLAQQFIDFMRTPQANAIWTLYGFIPAT